MKSFVIFIIIPSVLCDVSDLGGYNYQPPFPPVQFDEPSTPGSIYIPPSVQQDEIFTPPPFPPIPSIPSIITPVPTYLPPNVYPPVGTPPQSDDPIVVPIVPSVPALYGPPVPQVRVLNMSCEMDAKFQSLIQISGRTTGFPPLVMEDGSESCTVSSVGPNSFFIEMNGFKKMNDCGVRKCISNSRVNMCVTVRMPTVRNLKLPEDGMVTLQCSPQENIVAHTKHLRLGSNIVSARGRAKNLNNIVAAGGSQRNFDTRINVFRKSGNSENFDQVVAPGSTVNLGEDLILRAAVQEGDGWQYSRMGSVTVRSSSNQKSINLIDDHGCRIPGLTSICPQQPRQLSPLVTVLPFRAFLFQGVSKDDVMLMSVRMIGCVRQQDCFQNGVCADGFSKSAARFRRESPVKNVSDWESEFQFRVSTAPVNQKTDNFNNEISKEFIVLISMFGLLILTIVIVFIRKKIIY